MDLHPPTTGTTGERTRQALIEEYMSADGTTLPDGTTLTVHGCGPYFPDQESGPNEDVAANRRVEMFVFDGPIVPAPSGEISEEGATEYAAWVAQVGESVDFEGGATRETLDVLLHDDNATPLRTGASYRLTINGVSQPRAESADGWVHVDLPPTCPSSLRVEWGPPDAEGRYPYTRDIVVRCDDGSAHEQAAAKLNNLGYNASEDGFEDAVRLFQADYDLAESGLVNGELPPATHAELSRIFDTDCDATPRGGKSARTTSG